MTKPPSEFTKLPNSGVFTLERDTLVDSADLDRFIEVGGTIVADGNKIFVQNSKPADWLVNDVKIGKRSEFSKTIVKTAEDAAGTNETIFTVERTSVTIEGPTLTVKPGVEIVGSHPDGSGGQGFGVALLCPNCGLTTHVRCCAWCGQKHKPKRYQNDHCSAKCEKAAAQWDKGSAALQEEYDAADDSEDP